MNAGQIKQIIESNFPEIRSEQRKNGWSFWLDDGTCSTRIARVEQASPNRKLDFKPSITARLEKNKGKRIEITGQETQICEIIAEEIDLYQKHFS